MLVYVVASAIKWLVWCCTIYEIISQWWNILHFNIFLHIATVIRWNYMIDLIQWLSFAHGPKSGCIEELRFEPPSEKCTDIYISKAINFIFRKRFSSKAFGQFWLGCLVRSFFVSSFMQFKWNLIVIRWHFLKSCAMLSQ